MSTMNISLPDSLKAFIDEQVEQRGYGTSSEYVRELVRREQDRLQLRGLLLAGASSAPTAPADAAYFAGLRARVQGAQRQQSEPIGAEPAGSAPRQRRKASPASPRRTTRP